MLLYACKTLVAPCPVLDQFWVESATISNPADVGITTDQILYVATWGFGFVLLGWMIGYILGLFVGMIKNF